MAEPRKFTLVSFCLHLESVWFYNPFQSLCPVFSSGIKHNVFRRGDFSHLHPLLAARPGCPVPPVVEGSIRRTASLLHSMGKAVKDEDTWELIRGLRYSGSSLPSWLSLYPANLLYRVYFLSLHTWGRCDLGSIQGCQFCCLRLEGVRFWKLTRTYPDKKPPSLSVLTLGWCYDTHKPTQHLLAIPNIPVGWEPFTRIQWPTQFHLLRNYGAIFPKIFIYFRHFIIRRVKMQCRDIWRRKRTY